MKDIPVDSLVIGPAEGHLYHRSGTPLFNPGEFVSEASIEQLKAAGITMLTEVTIMDNPKEFIYSCKYDKQPVDSLVVGEKMTSPVYDPNGTLLLEVGTTVTEAIPKSFKARGFEEIFIKKSTEDLGMSEVKVFRASAEAAPAPAAVAKSGEIPKSTVQIDEERLIDSSRLTSHSVEKGDSGPMVPEGEPLSNAYRKVDKMAFRDEKEKDNYLDLRGSAFGDLGSMFKGLTSGGKINGSDVGDLSRKLIGGLVHDQEMALNLTQMPMETLNDQLAKHALDIMILSLNIGAKMGFGEKQILELGYGACLHNVGMLKMPQTTLLKKSKLNTSERLEIQRHPVHGINYLQRIIGIPVTTPYVAYQSHERMNGSGYPKGRKGDLIHVFSRIVAVADTYEALKTRRAYRSGVVPYVAMESVVKMCARNLFDKDVVRALLSFMSLFPVGSWVELSNGHLAKVVAANDGDFTRPVVSVIFENKKRITKEYRIDLMVEKDIKINRAFDGQTLEKSVMEGF